MERFVVRDATGIARRPRIAILLDRFDGRGGAETYSRDLAVWLVARGCEVHVVGRSAGAAERLLPVAFHALGRHADWANRAAAAVALVGAIGADVSHDMGVAFGCDVFHSHVGSPLACLDAADRAQPAWLRPLRRILRQGVRRRTRDRAARQFAANRSLCIALSRRGAADLAAGHGVDPARIRVVPNGVDAVRFHHEAHRGAGAAIRRRCGFSPDDVVVIGVAHNRRLKGMPALIRAVHRLRAEGLPLAVLLCGGRGAPRGVGTPIVDAGHVDDMAPFYAAADIAVQPSFHDACSLATLESLASGLPVITTRANGASELLTPGIDGIVLDDAADVEALIAVLRRLAADRWLRASLGRAGRRRAECLGTDMAFTSIVSVYAEVVAARGGRLEVADVDRVRRAA